MFLIGEKNMEKNNLFFEMAIDSEFSNNGPISLQVKVTNEELNYSDVFIILEESFKSYYLEDSLNEFSKENNFKYFFDDLRGNQNNEILTYYFIECLYNAKPNIFNKKEIFIECNLWFYYSPKDLNIAFGNDFMKERYLGIKPKILYKRNYRGFVINKITKDYKNLTIKYFIKDLAGFDKYGLKSLAKGYNINIEEKDILDDYKENMDLAVQLVPYDFLKYSLSDVNITLQIAFEIVKSFNIILKEVFSIDDSNLFNTRNIPSTIGTLVSTCLHKDLDKNVFKNNCIKLAVSKLNYLNPLSENYNENKMLFEKLYNINSLEELDQMEKNDESLFKNLCKLLEPNVFKYKLYQFASSSYILDISANNDMYILAFITGGRTMNCRPFEYSFKNGIDIDIEGAYSTVLQTLEIPLGRPRYYTRDINNNNKLTLRQFLNKLKKKLSPYWKIIVSGKITFEQDIIYSRIVNNDAISRKIKQKNFDLEDTLISYTDLVLLRKEIINGVITPAILDLIYKIGSNKEINELLNLEVVASIFWLEEDRIDDMNKFANLCLKDKGKLSFNTKYNCNIDTRNHYWFPYSIKDIVKKLREKRSYFKKLGQMGVQNNLKLTTNTIYGIISSEYFPLNNVVLGELITSSIRVKSYLMMKAYNSHLIITDGGPSSLEKFCFFRQNNSILPGIESLAQLYKKIPKYLYLDNLDKRDWNSILENPQDFDFTILYSLLNQHLKDFWKHYNIEIDFNVEWKFLIKKGSYYSKAHYYFLTLDEKNNTINPFFKIRGYRHSENKEYQNPIYLLLKQIAEEPEKDSFELNNFFYKSKKLLSLNYWKKMANKENKLPGDSIIIKHQFRLNNNHFPLMYLEEFNKLKKRSFRSYTNKKNIKIKQNLFEKYLCDGINKTITYYMIENDLKIKPIHKKDTFEEKNTDKNNNSNINWISKFDEFENDYIDEITIDFINEINENEIDEIDEIE